MGAAPPMTPPMTIAHSGRTEGGFRSERDLRGSGPRAAPHPGGECVDDKRGATVGNHGPPPRGGAGRPRRDPPPQPTRRPRVRRPPPPAAGGMVPPPPARERSRSTARHPAPAAGSHRNRGEQACPHQRARMPHRSRPVKAGEHEPEWYGDHASHDQNDASDTRFVACRGKAEGRNEAERPPPPPNSAARHTNATDPPNGECRAPSQVGGNPDQTAPPQARQTEQGAGAGHAEGHGPRGTALPAPSAGTARGAHATPPRGGGERTPRERKRTHPQWARGDYQKGNRTELAERTDRVE